MIKIGDKVYCIKDYHKNAGDPLIEDADIIIFKKGEYYEVWNETIDDDGEFCLITHDFDKGTKDDEGMNEDCWEWFDYTTENYIGEPTYYYTKYFENVEVTKKRLRTEKINKLLDD